MPTLRFKLRWPDGATASAKVTAAHPNDSAPVTYTGATDRLPGALANCAPTTLHAYLYQVAASTGARLDRLRSGTWRNENDLAPFAVVERWEDYTLERLAVVDGPDGPELHGWFDGVECRLEAKSSWLRSGFAACHPINEDLGLDWPMSVDVLHNATGIRERVDNATADPAVIEALERLADG